MKEYYLQIVLLLLLPNVIFGQDTLLIGQSIPEVVFAEDKEEQERVLTPSQIKIDAKDILNTAPITSADALQKSGAITIQMSQSGGGSPIIRGFEANRVLLIVDGVSK